VSTSVAERRGGRRVLVRRLGFPEADRVTSRVFWERHEPRRAIRTRVDNSEHAPRTKLRGRANSSLFSRQRSAAAVPWEYVA
jgi:hypothetical protein